MAQPRQGVVLRKDPYPWFRAAATPPLHRTDSRREATSGVLDLESVPAEDVGDPRRRVMLLERRFGVGVDAVREVDDLVPSRLDGGGNALLELDERLGRAYGGSVGHRYSGRWHGSDRLGTGPTAHSTADAHAPLSAPPTASPRRPRRGRR